MKARIEKTKDGMWLLIDDAVAGDGLAWAIREDEVEPIRNACNEYLERESQEVMKVSL